MLVLSNRLFVLLVLLFMLQGYHEVTLSDISMAVRKISQDDCS